MKNIDCYGKFSSDGEEGLLEELKQIQAEVEAVPPPDFSQAKSEESEEGSEEEENWGDDDDVHL